jgi:sirohydrochlorin ferrochelatase
MIVALIDNGSLEPAAHRNLRAVAAELSARTGIAVEAVSWKHSDRIPLGSAGLRPANSNGGRDTRAPIWTLAPFLHAHVARGQREFLFVPFFISAQGAIGSALRADLEKFSDQLGGFSFSFTEGLAARDAIGHIVAIRIRETIVAEKLSRPPVIVVDHGGPSSASAALRDELAAEVRAVLGDEIASVGAASMEGAHRPLFAAVLAAAGCAHGDVVVAPLFLSPGRHAGPNGDLAQIARAASARIFFTDLVGTHPAAVDALAAALRDSLTPTLTLSA